MPLISIIVPVYKVEPYLRRCVNSILAQTFPDFELILVDDGSPDHCPAICDAYAQQDSRVRVIHQKNGGLSAARNSGMEIAAGEYILFCDSDDYVSPDWCASLMAQVRESHDNYIVAGYVYEYDNDAPDKEMLAAAGVPVKSYAANDFMSLQMKDTIGYAWNVLYYADIIQKQNMRFSTDVLIEDLPFCLEYLCQMKEITYCSKALYHYYQRVEGTLSRKYYPESFRRWQEKYQISLAYIEAQLEGTEKEAMIHSIADYYLYFFLHSLSNTFDPRSTLSFRQKLRYNQGVVCSKEFQHCLAHTDGANENQTYLSFLKKKNYYAAYLYSGAAKLKSKLLK